MAEEIAIEREPSLKRLRIFKDAEMQKEYERLLEKSKEDSLALPKEFTADRLSKRSKARELAAQYFKKRTAGDTAVGEAGIKTN
jgi:hypothetical protein